MAAELDEITARISVLVRALQVRGIYDTSMEGLGSLLTDTGEDNRMFPVSNLAAYLGKGSAGGHTLQNVVQFLPIDMIATVLIGLYDARDRVKQTLFEVSGLSDILRGHVDSRVKLGQSRLKGQFASQRLDQRRRAIERAARNVIRLKAEIIAEQFDPTTLRELSGFDHLPEIVRLAQGGEPGTPDRIFGAVAQLLRNDKLRGFRIDIETDSTVALDDQEQKEARVEFLGAAGTFLEKTLPVVQAVPMIAPLMGEMLLFAVRGFRAGRTFESAFEDAVEKIKQASQQPTEPQPDPEAEARAQRAQVDLETAQAKAAIDIGTRREMAQLKGAERREALTRNLQEAQIPKGGSAG